MFKSYYYNGNFIIPFAGITCVSGSSTTRYELEVHTGSKAFGIIKERAQDFLTQYTAWLDSQSTPQL